MSKNAEPEEEPTPFLTGDWSVGISSRSSLSQAEHLALLGRSLRRFYDTALEEGVPDHLATLVERLEKKEV